MAVEAARHCALARHHPRQGRVTLYRQDTPPQSFAENELPRSRQPHEIILVNDPRLVDAHRGIHGRHYFHCPVGDLLWWWAVDDPGNTPALSPLLGSLSQVLGAFEPDVTDAAISARPGENDPLTLVAPQALQQLLNTPWGEGDPEPVPLLAQADDNPALLFQSWEMPGWAITTDQQWLAVPLAARLSECAGITQLVYHPCIEYPVPVALSNDYQSLSPAYALMLLARLRELQYSGDWRSRWLSALEQVRIVEERDRIDPQAPPLTQEQLCGAGVSMDRLSMTRHQWLDATVPGRQQRHRLSPDQWRNLLTGADRMAGQPEP